MPYITSTELLARYRILEKWGLDPTQISSDLIFYAESELNSRLASAFTVPFSAAHPTIKDLTMDLSYCKALETKDLKRWEARYKIVTDRITDIKEGRAFIVTGSGTLLESGAREIWSSSMDYVPVHSMLDAENQYTRVDSDLIEDLELERD